MRRGVALRMVALTSSEGVSERVLCCSFAASRVLRCSSDGKTLMAGRSGATSFRWCAKKARRIRIRNNVREKTRHEWNVGMVVVVSVFWIWWWMVTSSIVLRSHSCIYMIDQWLRYEHYLVLKRDGRRDTAWGEWCRTKKLTYNITDNTHLLLWFWFTKVGQGLMKHFLNVYFFIFGIF